MTRFFRPLPRKAKRASACKVCGQEAKYVLTMDNDHGEPALLDLLLCGYCGLLFVGTPITDEELAAAYASLDAERYYEEIGDTTYMKINRALEDLGVLLRSSGNTSVLDVGCGYGHFLDALTKTYPSVRAAGHELEGKSASACRSKGFKVLTCDLEDIRERFSLIALLDVAEHVPEPNRLLAVCQSLLGRDGYVYIHTPRRCFWDNFFLALYRLAWLRKLARAWLRTRVSIFHLQLWTDKALELSLKLAGFQLLYLKPELELSWPLERYARIYLGEKLRVPPPLVGIATRIADLLFVRLGTLKNKAICLGQRRESSGLV